MHDPIQRVALCLSGVLIALCTVAVAAFPPRQSGETAPPGVNPPATGPGTTQGSQAAEVQEDFFDSAAFLGDSITLALRNYNLRTGALGKATFLCAGSYSVRHAVNPEGLAISYRGEEMSPQQALRERGAAGVHHAGDERLGLRAGGGHGKLDGADCQHSERMSGDGNLYPVCHPGLSQL